ncbi:MAG TPA: MFS transporter [Candidatus Aminicenantes bacterium]|nr:MFS transporter [Candidatus Aminicenantes bacterium]
MPDEVKARGNGRRSAFAFLVFLGVISLFSDLTYEGARSIIGPYLLLLGASAATIGFVSGLGEFVGYGLRLITGIISDRTGRYWLIAIIGYAINMIAIPALALAPGFGWVYACALLVAERFGKAIRHPAKNTLASFAAREVGPGKGFAIQEALDQVGAFLGPMMLFAVLTLKGKEEKLPAYAFAFLLLGLPAAVTMALLLVARKRYPRPQEFEKDEGPKTAGGFRPGYWSYMAGIAFLAMGFADFPLMAFHFVRTRVLADNIVPVFYAAAMAVDAASALFFGRMYDRTGMNAVIIASAVSAFFAPLAFLARTPGLAAAGVVLWGIGLGAQESILKAVVTTLVPKDRRGTAFGVFNAGFGAFWFVGSWAMGILYGISIPVLVAFSLASQAASIPFFFRTQRLLAAGPAAENTPGASPGAPG